MPPAPVDHDVDHLGAQLDLGARGAVHGHEIALQRARSSWKLGWNGMWSEPISLIRGSGRSLARRVEEEAEPVLGQLVLVEVRAEVQAGEPCSSAATSTVLSPTL